ncbi:MAG: mechanosensitive ion channel family protein [Opitutaceae bacterium]
MKEILTYLKSIEILNNVVLDWFLAVAGICVLFLALRLMFSILKRRVGSLSKKTSTVLDDLIAAALESTRGWSLFVAAVWGGARFLDLGSGDAYVDFALLIALTIQVALWANRMVSAYIIFFTDAKKENNPGAVSAIQGMSFIVRLVIWSVALLLVVDNLGYDVTALVAGLGITGIAVALALQNILGDLFASLSIVLDKPFVIGDFIIVGDLMGVVERIGLKTTRVRSLSGEQLIFSNSDLLNSRVRNFKRMQERRVAFGFGVIYQTTPEQLESIPVKIKSIVEGIENARFDRAHFKGFGESSYDFEVVYYVLTADYAQYMDIQQSINLALCRWFAEEGIDFAYPTRTLFINREEV